LGASQGTDFGRHILSRQVPSNCTTPCAPFLGFAACNTTDCICAPFNSAAPGAVMACTSCLQPSLPYIASNLTLISNVCSKCLGPCNATLAAYIQSLECSNTTCACASFAPAGGPAIQACGTCVEGFDPENGEGVIEFAQECGITVNSSSSASSASASASGASATKSASSSSSTAASKSGAARVADGTFWKIKIPGLVAVIAVGLILM
jgi:hypothetical protein